MALPQGVRDFLVASPGSSTCGDAPEASSLAGIEFLAKGHEQDVRDFLAAGPGTSVCGEAREAERG